MSSSDDSGDTESREWKDSTCYQRIAPSCPTGRGSRGQGRLTEQEKHMRNWLILALLGLFAAAGSVRAQRPTAAPPTPPVPTVPVIETVEPLAPEGGEAVCGRPGRVWARGEYRLWWTKGNSLPPLVATSPIGTSPPAAGLLGLPTTTVLFGDSDANTDSRSGARITLGGWLDEAQTWGIEGNFFGLQDSTNGFHATSDSVPILTRPFFNTALGRLDTLLVAYPGIVTGSINATSHSTNLFGTELYLRRNLRCDCNHRVDALAG
jgi:hypothetical protein